MSIRIVKSSRLGGAPGAPIRQSSILSRLSSAKPIVLVVDDDEGVHETLNFILRAKCTVKCVFTAEEGLRYMEETPGVEFVFMDLVLPGLSGYEAMAIIKQNWPAVPVTIISETADLSPARAIDLGAFHCMRKEFDFDWMNELLETALAGSAAFREKASLVNSIAALTRDRDVLETQVAQMCIDLADKSFSSRIFVKHAADESQDEEVTAIA